MRSLIPLSRVSGILEWSVVEGIWSILYTRSGSAVCCPSYGNSGQSGASCISFLPLHCSYATFSNICFTTGARSGQPHPALLIHQLLIEISKRHAPRDPSLLSFQSTLHVDTSVSFSSFACEPRIIRRTSHSGCCRMSVRRFVSSATFRHPSNPRFVEVSCISTDTIRAQVSMPLYFAVPDLLDYLIEDGTLTCLLGRVAFSLHGDHLQSFSLGELEHLPDLRVDG